MEIILADIKHLSIIKLIVHETISTIYPHYYPTGAVNYFKEHHCDNQIITDIKDENIYILIDDDRYIGTVTIKNNEITRLFVLPRYQHMGYGKKLLDFAEEKIFHSYKSIKVAASLSAKKMYLLRGYKDIEYHLIETANGDFLCYDVMEKEKS